MRVAIIGGGIIGCSVAWHLAREGHDATIVERGRLGLEASWAAAGMIAPQAEAQGPGPFFDLCLRAREAFAKIVEPLRRESGIDPEYDEAGILYVAFNAIEQEELAARARWQRDAGGTAEELSGDQARMIEPSLSREAIYALNMPQDRRTENRQLTRAYAAAALAHGTKIREGATVEAILTKNSRATGLRLSSGSDLDADVIVNAAGAWSGAIRGLDADRIETYPVRGQMLCFEALRPLAGPSVFSLHGYVVPRRDGRLIAGSTMEEAGFDKRVTLDGIIKISTGAARMLPGLGGIAFREAWAGLRPATNDFLPVLGPSPSVSNVFYATGHFRSGILLSAISGEIIADLVHERVPPIDIVPFAPARFSRTTKVKAIGLVRDILFRSRIDAAAQAIGVEVAYASNLEQAITRSDDLRPDTVFVDLSDTNFPAVEVAAIKHRGGAPRLIGFASHIDLKTLAAARSAGFDLTLSRSEFTARIAEFLK